MTKSMIMSSLKFLSAYKLTNEYCLEQADLEELIATISQLSKLMDTHCRTCQMGTVEAIEYVRDNMFEVRCHNDYAGDYSMTIETEGYVHTFTVNDIDCEAISDDEVLIHINAANCQL